MFYERSIPPLQETNDGAPWEYRRMCNVCHARLNRHVSPEGITTWHHGHGGYDHEPAPVMEPDEQDVILVCDFCLEPHPTWDFNCENFVDRNGPVKDDLAASLGAWTACNTCKDLVMAGQWDELADRSLDGQKKYNEAARKAYEASPAVYLMARLGILDLHQQFNAARTGPPVPIETATWLSSQLATTLWDEE